MSQRTVITGGVLVTDSDEIRADLVIDDHEIVAMLADASGVDADEEIDATGLLIIPGGVDIHGPAPHMETTALIQTSLANQRAAAAGGVTTLVTESGQTPTEDGTRPNPAADIAYWYSITGGTLPTSEQLSRMVQTGIAGFSASLRGQPGNQNGTFTDGELLAVMKLLSPLEVPLTIGPLHPGITVTDPLAEIAAVSTALLFAEHTGAWIHLRHVTTAAAMQHVVGARARGVRVTASVSALHLALAASDATRLVRTLPPLRPQEMLDALWAFVLDESVDCISSIVVDRKGRESAPISDIQTALSLFWSEAVDRRKMSRSQAVRMLSANPAQIAGLHPRKGALRVGSEADLVLLDPHGTWVVRNRDILNEGQWSALNDREITGFVVRTMRRGVTIYDADRHDEELLPDGSGTLLSRA
jgi:dihydroorotase-like cyclic amidohydrolase